MIFKHALVRPPADSFMRCISSHPLVHTVNIEVAREQHKNYCHILSELGLEIIELPPIHSLPDSCFVEDVAIIRNSTVLITRMAKASRLEEYKTIMKFFEDNTSFKILYTEPPATLEGGDVIHLDNSFICGISQRTNENGAKHLRDVFQLPVETIKDHSIIHLKSWLTYLGKDTFLVHNRLNSNPVLQDFERIIVSQKENYSANSLTIGNTVLLPSIGIETSKRIKEAGFDVVLLNMSEFEKCEGALTCLSILF
ncbi:MAG: dimethylarginine dimethylaminohydrolase family protein [Candidatus Heimdallarchaeaceae archaeon]